MLRRIASLLHSEILATRFDEVIASLMLRPPAHAWKPIRAVRGWIRIYLGGLLWHMPIMAGGTTVTETFNVGNNTVLSGVNTWTETTVSTNWETQNSKAKLSVPAGGDCSARCESAVSTDNYDVSVTLTTFTHASTGSIYGGPVARYDAGTANQYYAFLAERDAGTLQHSLYRVNGASFTRLGSADPTDPANGTVLKVRANGSAISGYIDAATSVSPQTDTNYSGRSKGGIYGFADNASHVLELDDWQATDFSSSVTMDINDSATVSESVTMHMPISLKMMKLP